MEELYRFKNRDEYLKALDTVIMQRDIQERDIGKGRIHRYFPQPILEAIADYIFQSWNVIDEKYAELRGSLVCTVKIVYVPSYPGADELFCTGSAAVLIQDAKNTLEYQVPAVKSRATGNALSYIGNVFGRNLARKLNKETDIPDGFHLRKYGTIEEKEPVKKKPVEPVKQEPPKKVIEPPF